MDTRQNRTFQLSYRQKTLNVWHRTPDKRQKPVDNIYTRQLRWGIEVTCMRQRHRNSATDTEQQSEDKRHICCFTHRTPDWRQQASRDKRHQTWYPRHETPDKRQQTKDTRQKTPDKKHQTKDIRQKTANKRHQAKDTRQKTPDKRHQTKDTRQ